MNKRIALVDSHCHLDLAQFDDDRAAVLERARQAGVEVIVLPGIDVEQNRQALAFAEQNKGVYVAVGVHPNSSGDFGPQTLDDLESLAAHDKVVAIGEIGLDYHWKIVDRTQQAAAFEAQLSLAARLGLPVIIHCREAIEDVASTLRQWVQSAAFRDSPLARRPFAGVLHAFSGDRALADEAASWGFAVSLGGPVTFRNAQALRDLVPRLPLDRLMLETDAPYLTPHPYRGQRNEPARIVLVCEEIARVRDVTSATVAEATTAVACRFFGLEDALSGVCHAESHG